jgi:hypothetical protein
VLVKGKFLQTIRDTKIDGMAWAATHWKTIIQNYSKTLYFKEVSEWLAPCYLENKYTNLSNLNRSLIEKICAYLGIHTVIRNSSEFNLQGDRSGKLLCIAKAVGASHYVSGPSAMDYLDTGLFDSDGVAVEWFDYSRYPVYPQEWGDFTHHVSIIDLLFNCGPCAGHYMKYCHEQAS